GPDGLLSLARSDRLVRAAVSPQRGGGGGRERRPAVAAAAIAGAAGGLVQLPGAPGALLRPDPDRRVTGPGPVQLHRDDGPGGRPGLGPGGATPAAVPMARPRGRSGAGPGRSQSRAALRPDAAEHAPVPDLADHHHALAPCRGAHRPPEPGVV